MAAKQSKSSSRKKDVALAADTRICVLYGSEDVVKREHLDSLRAALHEAHGEIETLVFDGQSAELAEVLDELRSLGLMQQYKVVIVDQADQFVTKYREALERYAASPVDNATLVLRSGRWNRGKLDKAIAKVGGIIKCDAMSRQVLVGWLQARADEKYERRLKAATAQLLIDRIGNDPMRLDSELAKLSVMVGDGQHINEELIAQVVGRGSDEDAWAVQEAVLEALADKPGRRGDVGGTVIEKIHELVALSGQPDVLILYFVADLMRKLMIASVLQSQGVSESQIGKEMKLWGDRQRLFMSLLRGLSPGTAARLFDTVIEYDAGSKSGRGTALRNLECFCATLSTTVR